MRNNDISHAFRLLPGQDLKKAIQQYVNDHKIKAGWLVTGVGSSTEYNIRFANQPNGTKSIGHFEIVSLTGTVAEAGSHIHIIIADNNGKTLGGHLTDSCKIFTTAEIVLIESGNYIFTRIRDGSTQSSELEIKNS